jgi:hypothetical protein
MHVAFYFIISNMFYNEIILKSDEDDRSPLIFMLRALKRLQIELVEFR